MAFPSRNAVLRGFFFIVFLVIYLMCEKWMITMKVTGTQTYREHVFNHVFLMWTIKQCFLALMYILWKAIDRNWIGMRRFRHAEIDEEDSEPQTRRRDTAQNGAVANGNVNATADDVSLIQPERPKPRFRQKKKKTYTKLLFLLPSMFSQAHILLIYFGMKLTYPSSVIMLTGTASMFVTLLSLAFLAKQISSFMWIGVTVSTIGFAISGLSDYLHKVPPGYEPYGIAAGDLLYTMGQITMTTQMIYEEKFMRKLSIHPMKFLGSEGIYSMVFAFIMLMSFCLSDTQYSDLPNNRIEDIADAVLQFGNSSRAVLAVFGSLISYVVFTYLGMILIKDHGAMSRIMIESLAWCLYWTILVLMHWEQYYITQIPGLVLVPCGVLIFSHIVACPCANQGSALDPFLPQAFTNENEQEETNRKNETFDEPLPVDGNGTREIVDDDQLIQDGNGLMASGGSGDDNMITW